MEEKKGWIKWKRSVMENECLKAAGLDNLEETIGEERLNKMLECVDGQKQEKWDHQRKI